MSYLLNILYLKHAIVSLNIAELITWYTIKVVEIAIRNAMRHVRWLYIDIVTRINYARHYSISFKL